MVFHIKDSYRKRLAVFSLGLNIFLTATVFLLYFFTGSAALLAETVHSFTDVIGSILLITGIYLSEKKSKQFPWGLYKVENLVAVLIAVMIFFSAYEIARMIYKPPAEALRNLEITLVILFLMAFPIIMFSRYEGKKAKMLNSPSLMADAASWKMDIAPLAVVSVGLIGAWLSSPFMDRIAALVVLVIVIRAGYGIFKDSMKSLLDASVDRTTLNDIRDVIEGFPQVKEIISLNARNSGRFIFIDINMGLSLKRLKEAHEITKSIEQEIINRIPFVDRVIIHYEPVKKDYHRYAVPLLEKLIELNTKTVARK